MKTTSREQLDLRNLLPLSEKDFRHFLRLWEKAQELEVDSRVADQHCLFFAHKGILNDGHTFISEILSRKKSVGVLADPSYPRQTVSQEKKIVRIPNLSNWAGKLGAIFYHHPSHRLRVVGVTGTDGKTSTTHLITQAYHAWGYKTAGIGTLGVYVVDDSTLEIPHQNNPNTTPDPIILQRILCFLHRKKIKTVVMEVSSHGLTLGRVQEIAFDSAVWTNLSSEHLDYHATLENYAHTKVRLFELLQHSSKKNKHGIIGLDSFLDMSEQKKNLLWTQEIIERIKLQSYPMSFFHRSSKDYQTRLNTITSLSTLKNHITVYHHKLLPQSTGQKNLSQKVCIHTGKLLGRKKRVFTTDLLGDFNSQNFAAAFLEIEHFRKSPAHSFLSIKKHSFIKVKKSWEHVSIKGRLENFPLSGYPHPRHKILKNCLLYIDYAHTPQALEKTILSLRNIWKTNTSSPLICIFGCGGNRDRIKRKPMGRVACRLAEITIITDDNPRTEDPRLIRKAIVSGWKEQYRYLPAKKKSHTLEVIAGRKEAIRRALEIVPARGVILLAGKGHEDYQIIGGKKHPFDERKIIKELLK